ncbi:glycoside hydrolase family 15 protein [Nocardioides sp. CFH 31398]|uniref:glycoside hydrolase family 15 protein n=1 Tax=Nocardioides sp. CFH 31398 TaxID=2919579 RepID=UPI001F063473|nr:glycoside hydrolase family 15 protein [Nocardioides sp. CFH 31398]MCH1867185.1 glycoside hydrolase family 15 protein [Nocardioides sp. CFH 31398]
MSPRRTTGNEQPWTPISDHGLVGDLRTCALVDTEGTVDWFCAPRFDSPSVFGSVLDPDVAGSWSLRPAEGTPTTQQYYFPDSAILVTRFLTEEGVAEVHDFMPLLASHDAQHRQRLVRRVVAVRGTARMAMRLAARPDYGRVEPTPDRRDNGVLIEDGELSLGLSASVDLEVDGADVVADVTLRTGEQALFVLEVLEPGDEMRGTDDEDVADLFDATAGFWRSWLSTSTYTGRWREMVERSAITLKLLTHEPTGAIVAAPTTSLPEHVGGSRNWDYRYVWMRDAAFSLYALLRLGFTDEAGAFVEWLSQRLGERGTDDEELGPLRVLYTIDGEVPTEEHELDHLAGYRDSRPVRVGNAAVAQLQLDIYGELIDSIYLYNKYGPGISHDAWSDLLVIVEWLMEHWDDDDAGMWEIRDDPKPHTTSRLMAWVAIERMIRVARQRGLPGDVPRWSQVRDEIYHRIQAESWNDEVGAYMQYEDSDVLDAGVLLMPMVKFLAPNDPRFVSTLAVIEDRLVSDSLVFRYDLDHATDGLDGEEGTFSLCSFWYVEALTRVGRLDEARLALEKMFTYANHLGLYAEQVGLTGEQLGNFPQAFTHLSLISAAINLDRALG